MDIILRLIIIYKNEFIRTQKFLVIINSFGVLILRLICLSQFDIKSIIAISSMFVHIGLIIIRIIIFFKIRLIGGYLIMIFRFIFFSLYRFTFFHRSKLN